MTHVPQKSEVTFLSNAKRRLTDSTGYIVNTFEHVTGEELYSAVNA